MSCEHCFKGVTHEGEPAGTLEVISGIECYIGTPASEYAKEKAVLFLPDAFGIPLINNKLLIDDFARNGFKTYLVDVFEGIPAPVEALLNPEFRAKFDFAGWKELHSDAVVMARIKRVMNVLREQGVTSFAATGYCFGARAVFDLAFEGAISVSAVSHPSQIKCPEDLERYLAVCKAPLLINSCEIDRAFPAEAQAKANIVLKDFGPGFKQVYWEGCTHGFAVRGDLSDPKVKAGKEGSFKETVEWFVKHFQG